MGRFGLFDPDSFAITPSSVERCQLWLDLDAPPQRPVEGAPRDRPLETGQAPARVGAATRLGARRDEPPLLRHETQKLALRRPPPAADTAPERPRHALGVSSPAPPSGSTGMPAGTSSGGARRGGDMSRSTSSSVAAISSASGPCVATTSAGASDSS